MTLYNILVFVYTICLLQTFSSAFHYTNGVKYIDSYREESICNTELCLQKCCDENEYADGKNNCVTYNHTIADFSNAIIFTEQISETKKKFKDLFVLVPGTFKNTTFQELAYDLPEISQFTSYLVENGDLYLHLPNAYKRWTVLKKNNYCVDYRPPGKNGTGNDVRFYSILEDNEEFPESSPYVSYTMLVSCFFMALVLAVYCILPDLRNLCGLILMAYDFTLLLAFFQLAMIQLIDMDIDSCIRLTMGIYFSFIASFCWMNVMSFDIWWTFRGYAKARPIHRRGERFKFVMYCLYAWGLPLAMTIALLILNTIDLSHLPWFITPKIPLRGCFIEGGEKFLYLYTPMLILILTNWILYLMTAYNIWRLTRGTAVLDSAAAGTPASHRSQRSRLGVYLKLSIVMGLNWLLEVVSYLVPGFRIWYLTDAYNILLGVAIFIIFVCKKKILKKLIKRYRSFKAKSWSPRSKSWSSSSMDSNSSQETRTLQVCISPSGPTYPLNPLPNKN